MKKRLAVFASGGGTNMQAIIDAINNNEINGEIVYLVSSNPKAGAIARAINNNISYGVYTLKDFENAKMRDQAILTDLKKYNIDYILLAGYLGIVTPVLLNEYRGKIINIHPSLLPKHGGKGMYGIIPHRAAIAAKEAFSGATVHFVDEGTDTGAIILQKSLPILPTDDEYSLQERILKNIEHKIFPQAVKLLCEDKVKLIDGKAIILEE